MKNRISASLTLALLTVFAASTAMAAQSSNFVSGNANNDGKYTPRKVVQRPSKDPNHVPGFWEKEAKRSGLGGRGLWNPFSDAGKFLKEKDDAYRAKHGVTSN